MRRSFTTLFAMALLATALLFQPAHAATLTAVNVVATPTPGTANQPVTVSAQVTGGNSLLYQFWVGDPSATYWTLLKDYSTTSSVSWTPTAAGIFPLVIRVKELTSTSLFDLQNDLFFTVSAATGLSAVSLSASPASPQLTNTAITLKATPTGGTSLQYQFIATNASGSAVILENYGTAATCAWTPATAGTYSLQVWARQAGTTQVSTITSKMSYTITSTVGTVSLTAAPASPQVTNTAIKLTATATNVTSPQYRFTAANGSGAATVLQDYSTTSTCTWTPTTTGTYTLQVLARQTGTTQIASITKQLSYTITAPTPALSAVNLTASPASPQAVNTAVKLTATATGGTSVQYRFTAANGSSAATVLQDYSTTSTCTWTPTTGGTYTLQVLAREGTTTQNPSIVKSLSYTISAVSTPATALNMSVSPATGTVNVPVTVTATAVGGSNLQYQFWVGDQTATQWTLLQDYGTANTCPWNPTASGVFPLVARVRTVGSTSTYDVQNDVFYTVNAGAAGSSVSLTASPLSPQPISTPITLTATASGGTSFEYQFSATLNGTATIIRAYAATPTCPWTPTVAGAYTLSVAARLVGGTQNPNMVNTLNYTINPVTISGVSLTASPTSPQPVQTAIKLTAAATGGTSLQYKFQATSSAGVTTVLQNYAATATYTWTPATADTYTLQVFAEQTGTTQDPNATATLTYTIGAAQPLTGLTASPASPQPVNTNVTLTAQSAGGSNLQYKFTATSSTGTVTTLQNYATTSTCAWTPTTADTYTLTVYAQPVGGTTTYQVSITYTVTTVQPVLTGLTASPASPQPVNTKITLTAQAASGSNLQYKFTATSSTGTVTTLQNYATTQTCAWTPTAADTYTLTVYAQPVGGTATTQVSIPYTVQPGGAANYYVATNGNDSWTGKLIAPNSNNTDGPFATLEGAQAAVRKVRSSGLPQGGVTVWVRGGSYYRTTTFALTSSDSGTSAAPITWQAYPNEVPRITGAKTVTGFTAVTDSTVLSRIPAAAQPNVVQANLTAQGITDFGSYQPRGSFYPTRTAAMEMFFQDNPMTLARWPNVGTWASITSVPGGTSGATIGYSGSEPSKWSNVSDIWLHGFWTWDWADSYVNVTGISNGVITTASPYGGSYGYSVGGRFYAQNILEELDTPGEYYVNRSTGILYFWPPASLSSGQVTVSMSNVPLITMNGTSYVNLNGLTIESARCTGMTVTGGSNNNIVNCTVRNMGNYAIDVEGGSNQVVQNNMITGDGDGGIIINGTGLTATNNEIAHYARWVYCYQAGIHIEGSGNEISHNKIYDAPHNAVLMDGTNHMLEYNEIYQVVLQTQDSGAVYTGGSGPNTVRYNFIHDLGKGQINMARTPFAAGIYDDNGGGNLSIIGNVLANGYIGILFNGGSGNTIQNNVITGFGDDVWYDGSGGSPSGNKINTNVFVDNAPVWMNGASSSGNTITNNLVGVNPLFVSPSTNNYQLQSSSPAYTSITGFQTIPFSQIGRK